MKTKNTEYETFDGLMGNLLKVPHSELKAKLEKEKKRKKRSKRSSSVSRASCGDV
jgi:hypothetical protein